MIGTVIDTNGQKHRLWAGALELAGELGPATPEVSRCGDVSVVWVAGLLTSEALLEIAVLMLNEKRAGQATIIVALASSAGELGGLAAVCNSIVELTRRTRVLVWAPIAFGAAVYLAMKLGCRVYMPPAGQVGYLRVGLFDGGGTCWDATDQLVLSLHELRRWVERSTWRRLRDTWINGEQAEAIGICEVVSDLNVLVARYQGVGRT